MKQIQIIGHLGKDAEVKKFGDTDYTSFSIAVTEKVKNEDVTTWFDCLKYGANDNLRPYLLKGVKVFIQGNFNAKTSEKDGKTYLNLNVNVDKLQLIGSKSDVQTEPPAQQSAPVQSAPPVESDLPF